jgi:hypothetical protein
VFVYRALISGPIEALILFLLYCFRDKLFLFGDKRMHQSDSVKYRWVRCLPLLWKQSIFYDTEYAERDGITVNNGDISANPIHDHDNPLSSTTINMKQSHRQDIECVMVLDQLRVRFTLNFITDIVIMLAFGTFFPPLTWLLLMSLTKHVIQYRLLFLKRFRLVLEDNKKDVFYQQQVKMLF